MSRRHRAQAYHPDHALAIPTVTEALALGAILENGRAYAALSNTQRRMVTDRSWLARPPRKSAGVWQVNERGIEALRRLDVGERAIRLRVDTLHAEALITHAEREKSDVQTGGVADGGGGSDPAGPGTPVGAHPVAGVGRAGDAE